MQLKHARWLGLNDIGTQSCQTVEDIWRKKHLPNPALHRFSEGSGRWGIPRVFKNFSNLLLPTIYCFLPRATPRSTGFGDAEVVEVPSLLNGTGIDWSSELLRGATSR